MLVLSRKVGEEIRIGNDIVVKVNRLAGGRVSIGIEAPDHVKIVRGELQQLIEEFDEPAANNPPAFVASEYAHAMPLASRVSR